jgi:hypothetical protein
MSRCRSAAEIMHEAILAAKLVSLENLEADHDYIPGDSPWDEDAPRDRQGFVLGQRIWDIVAYRRDGQGRVVGGPERRKLYENIEKRRISIAQEFKQAYPEFAAAYDAIFGDPFRIPSYPHFMKLVKIGRTPDLTAPALWDKLPDSFECIYQLSLLNDDVGMLLANATITKETSLKTIRRLRRKCDAEAERRAQQKRDQDHEELKQRFNAKLEDTLRQTVLKEMYGSLPEAMRTEVDQRVAKLKELFLTAHPNALSDF